MFAEELSLMLLEALLLQLAGMEKVAAARTKRDNSLRRSLFNEL